MDFNSKKMNCYKLNCYLGLARSTSINNIYYYLRGKRRYKIIIYVFIYITFIVIFRNLSKFKNLNPYQALNLYQNIQEELLFQAIANGKSQNDTNNIFFKIIPKKGCISETKLIIGVFTYPEEFYQRDVMRKNWTRSYKYDLKTRVIFLIEESLNNLTNNYVNEESQHYGDILMLNSKEDYKNRVFKMMGLLNYVNTYCKNIKCVAKINSYMYETAVMPTMEQICLQSADGFDMISGCVLNATNVMQNSNYTQEISFNQQFTNGNLYFLIGYSVISKMLVGLQFSLFFNYKNYFNLPEDILFTGIIRDVAKIQINDIYCPYCCNLEYNRTHYLPAEQDTVPYDDSKILEILPRQGCEDSTKLIVGIRSAPNEWEDRDWIRNTWAKHYKTNTKIIFLIGKHKKNTTISNFLQLEQDKYGDILVMGFNDHYYNLTLKDYGFFEYILKHCKNVNCILKPDIDTVINVSGFELLCDLLPKSEQMITGRYWESGVVRNFQSKWYVPKYVYAKENYAPFPVGWTFFISGNGTIEKLQNTIKSKTTFLISENYRRLSDDALIMGDIRILAGIPFQDIGGFGLQQVSYWSDIRTGYQEIPLASEVEHHNREEIWQKMKASINYK